MSSGTQALSGMSSSAQNGISNATSPATLRHRASQKRLNGVEDSHPGLGRRRSSHLSEVFSDTHRSFRSSTDDLLLPKARATDAAHESFETTNWHSVPLALALLPAVGGLLFKDGSAVVTDITLLGLAAIFLNWALRIPWEWYHSAQSIAVATDDLPSTFEVIEEEDDDEVGADPKKLDRETSTATPATFNAQGSRSKSDRDDPIESARQELRVHELLALLACFLFPLLGAWFLHAIRSQLTRPSEGLVSNYNLTIFLLVAEIRPLSHLIKMIQRRTLFLQKKVDSSVTLDQRIDDRDILVDVSRRLGELETHAVNTATAFASETPAQAVSENGSDGLIAKASAQAMSDLRKSMQPELDALNRAMRRYEKRMTISAIQVEARLQDLEARLKDVVVLAAAAQRSVDKHPQNYARTLANWLSAMVIIPARFAWKILGFPIRLTRRSYHRTKEIVDKFFSHHDSRDLKAGNRSIGSRPRPTLKRPKGA